jgi:hypothetical protein
MREPELTSREEWISVLKLSNMWGIAELRQEAVEELSKISLTSLEKVLLAREYKVEKWLVDGYAEFIKQGAILSDEEKKTLESHATIRIYELREDTYKRGTSQYHETFGARYGWTRYLEGVEARVRNTFSEELADIRSHQRVHEEEIANESENDVILKPLYSAKKLSARKKGKKGK